MSSVANGLNQKTAHVPEYLYVTAELLAKPGKEHILRELMLPTVAKARTEPGCKHCTLLEVQSEPGRLVTYEIWTDRAAFEAHMVKPHIRELGPKIGEVLAQPLKSSFLYYGAISPDDRFSAVLDENP